MGRVVVSEFLSLDGVMEDPGGAEGSEHGGWSLRLPDPEGYRYKLDEIAAHDALLLGRTTYEGFAEAWPSRTDEIGFADRMNAMTKYVVSSTLRAPRWQHTTVLAGNATTAVAQLKSEMAGDLLVAGSAMLVRSLLDADLVDELRLMVFPVVLGDGKRLFDGVDGPTALELGEVRRLDSGTCILVYRPSSH